MKIPFPYVMGWTVFGILLGLMLIQFLIPSYSEMEDENTELRLEYNECVRKHESCIRAEGLISNVIASSMNCSPSVVGGFRVIK